MFKKENIISRWLSPRKTIKLAEKLKSLHAVGAEVASSLDTEELLVKVLNSAKELTGAEQISLFLFDPTTNKLFERATKRYKNEVELNNIDVDNSFFEYDS